MRLTVFMPLKMKPQPPPSQGGFAFGPHKKPQATGLGLSLMPPAQACAFL